MWESLPIWRRIRSPSKRLEFNVEFYGADVAGTAPGTLLASFDHPGQTATNSFSSFTNPDVFLARTGDVIEIDIDGTVSDQIVSGVGGTGTAIFEEGVTLNLNVISSAGYWAPVQILDIASASGVTPNVIANSGSWNLGNLFADGTIVATPEPTTGVMVVFGAVALASRRRRRND